MLKSETKSVGSPLLRPIKAAEEDDVVVNKPRSRPSNVAAVRRPAQPSLQDEIDAARKDIRTDSYPLSLGEWISIYEKRELDIHPEFQRFFRWSPNQKSRLIESIFLGIPIPQIFVAQRADGVWDVVDGLQRLSTIFQFVGILRAEDGSIVEPLVLEGTKYLPSLKGYKWEDAGDPDHSLSAAQRLLIKRSKIDASIILRESEERVKYELFQRLNTGGSMLSDQEVRNVILIMVDKEFYRWLRDLSGYAPFVECIGLSDRAIEEQYDVELVLRFIIFRKMQAQRLRGLGDLGDFLTDTAATLAQDRNFDKREEERAFRITFDVLAGQLGSDAFRKWDADRSRFVGGFSVSAFETVALGLGYHYQHADRQRGRVTAKVKSIWTDREFTSGAGSGVRASTRIPSLIPYGRRLFNR